MPDKFLSDVTVQGIILAAVLSVLRVIYDNKTTKSVKVIALRVLLECCICGCLVFAIDSGVKALEINESWIVFFSGVIGWLGTSTVRSFAITLANKSAHKS